MYRIGATRPGQAALMAASRLPGVLRWAAAMTRVPPSAIEAAAR
jgi:hypothetical protein